MARTDSSFGLASSFCAQLERTEKLIAEAEAKGNERLVEMNRPVELSLVRIIDGLEALAREGREDEPDAA